MADPFKFELVSPERLLVSQQVQSVLVPGTEGEMTVMAHHAPVMSTLRAGLVVVTGADGKVDRYVVFGGFADILPDSCTLLAESAVSAADSVPPGTGIVHQVLARADAWTSVFSPSARAPR